MSNSVFVTALGISVIYTLLKFIEMRFIVKENKPFKLLFRDSIFVYLSIVLGHFVIEQLAPLAEMKGGGTQVFTDTPNF